MPVTRLPNDFEQVADKHRFRPVPRTDNDPRYLARCLGIRFEYVRRNTHTWDGHTIRVPCRPPGHHPLETAYHEIAHYQVAPPQWRLFPNYGMYSSPWCGQESRRHRNGDDDESRASLLGILWIRASILPKSAPPDMEHLVLDEHNWHVYPEDGLLSLLRSTLRELYAMRLIDKRGIPQLRCYDGTQRYGKPYRPITSAAAPTT